MIDRKGGYERQYTLEYKRYRFPVKDQWRNADMQDRDDMPSAVLARWRKDHPFEQIHWNLYQGELREEVMERVTAELAALAKAKATKGAQANTEQESPDALVAQHRVGARKRQRDREVVVPV